MATTTQRRNGYAEDGYTNIALVARDWRLESRKRPGRFSSAAMGLAPHFHQIMRVCSNEGADVVLFALWSHNERNGGPIRRRWLFPEGTDHQIVVVAPTKGKREVVQVWHRDGEQATFDQQFRRSADASSKKKALLENLDERVIGKLLVLICGESNIIATRARQQIVDPIGFRQALRRRGVRIVLNPVHSYMRRPEMRRKRAAISRWSHTMVSVWNRGVKDGIEANVPWELHIDGVRAMEAIREVEQAIPGQPGVRIGMVRLAVPRHESLGRPAGGRRPAKEAK